jgi:hypothetical protein
MATSRKSAHAQHSQMNNKLALQLLSSTDQKADLLMFQSSKLRLLCVYFTSRHFAGLVVILDDINSAMTARIALDNCQRTVGTKGLHGFGSSIVVVISDLANKNAAYVLLDQIDLAVEVAIALDLDNPITLDGLDQIGFAVAVGVDQCLVFVFAYMLHPLIGAAIPAAMGDGTVRAAVAGKERESQR